MWSEEMSRLNGKTLIQTDQRQGSTTMIWIQREDITTDPTDIKIGIKPNFMPKD